MLPAQYGPVLWNAILSLRDFFAPRDINRWKKAASSSDDHSYADFLRNQPITIPPISSHRNCTCFLQRKLFSLNKESLPKTDNLIFKAINKTAYVTYVPRIDKTGIKKIVTSDCKCKTISIQVKYFMKSDVKEPSALQSIPRSPWRLFSEYFFSPDVAGVDPTAPTTTSTTPIPLVCTLCPVLFSIVQSSSILNM